MKLKRRSLAVKLWAYFILFAAVILSALWLLQTVFMQSFYEDMKARDLARVGDELAASYGEEDFVEKLEKLTFRNMILAVITDSQGQLAYTSDEHGSGGPGGGLLLPGQRQWQARALPQNFSDFLTELTAAPGGRVSYTLNNQNHQGKTQVFGALLKDGSTLYLSTPLEALNATTDIIRTQLMYVTILALFVSFVIAYFIAKKFAKPVQAITAQAGALAQGEFDKPFDKGFCVELDHLAEALEETAQELSKVEKLRRDFLANVSHDLRTPLTMVKAYTEMIRDISGDNKEKREAHLAVIAGEADRLTTLVNDLLDLSVIQSGGEKLSAENVDLSGAVKKVVSRFQPILEHEGYHVHATIEPDQYALCDKLRLTQVLYNLIGNAINHIGEDKTIYITVQDLGSAVRFEVTDHGEGIPEEDLPRIWERYYKSQNHRRNRTGTGLGLSIVKEILIAHGARYGAVSKVGEGSTFWFELKK